MKQALEPWTKGGQQVRQCVVDDAAEEWCQHPDCFWAGCQLSPSFGTQMQANLHPSSLQPRARHCNGLYTDTKLWLCLCIRHMHWQHQLYTRQPITLQPAVWTQQQLRKKLAWGALSSLLSTSLEEHAHRLCDRQKQPCSLNEGNDFAQCQHKACQRIVPLASVDG